MTEAETYKFLFDFCRREAKKYVNICKLAICTYGENPQNTLDAEYINEMSKKKERWEACVELLESECPLDIQQLKERE